MRDRRSWSNSATHADVERRAMVSKAIKRLCERAGMPYHSPHKLRHGFTAYALKSAKTIAELKAISQNLMHSSLTITDSIYGVLSGEDVASRIAGLGSGQARDDGELVELFRRFLRENKL
jgi:integrase